MHLVAGLGNIGPEYHFTRHNIGFLFADKLQSALALPPFSVSKKFKCDMTEGKNVKIIKPTTFMNESGQSVALVASFFKITQETIIVVHDELDLPFGQLKIQKGKSAAGHKGVQSVIDRLGTADFWRIRIGIGGEHQGELPSEKYVLTEFTPEEQTMIQDKIIADAYIAFMQILKEGPEKAAQQHNQKKDREARA